MHNRKRSFAAFKDDKKVLFEDFFESSDDDGDGDCGLTSNEIYASILKDACSVDHCEEINPPLLKSGPTCEEVPAYMLETEPTQESKFTSKSAETGTRQLWNHLCSWWEKDKHLLVQKGFVQDRNILRCFLGCTFREHVRIDVHGVSFAKGPFACPFC